MRKLYVLGAMLALVPLVMNIGGATAAPKSGGGPTVLVTGNVTMQQNEHFGFTYRFAPTRIQVPSGATLTFDGATLPPEPHTASIVDLSDIPTNALQAIQCGFPGGACEEIISRHETEGPVLEDDADGEQGLDGPGDSLILPPNQAVSRVVTAPAGTTLYYLCAIHPWMQGWIEVTE